VHSKPDAFVFAVQPLPAAPTDKAPTIALLSLRRLGVRIYVASACATDAPKAAEVIERDSKPTYLAYSRSSASFRTRAWLPRAASCGRFGSPSRAATRSRSPRSDKSGKASRSASHSLVKHQRPKDEEFAHEGGRKAARVILRQSVFNARSAAPVWSSRRP
jgi:hypothetical protein